MTIIMAAAGLNTGQEIPTLLQLTDPLNETIGPTGDRPIVAVRFQTNGDIEEATGDTGSALVYSKVGEWVAGGPNDPSDWELLFDVQTEDVGDPGTWTGSTRGSYITLNALRTFIWTKDGTDGGQAESVVDLTLRQISDTSNSASRIGVNYQSEITV